MFGGSLQPSGTKSARPTVLKRSTGQIMTEENVIQQIEENNNKRKLKQSRSTSRKSNETKRRKTETHGMINKI
jgi:hypothetical protein